MEFGYYTLLKLSQALEITIDQFDNWLFEEAYGDEDEKELWEERLQDFKELYHQINRACMKGE